MVEYKVLRCEPIDDGNEQRGYSIEIMCKSLRFGGLFGSKEENIVYSGDRADWYELETNRKVNGQVERILNHTLSQFKREERNKKAN